MGRIENVLLFSFNVLNFTLVFCHVTEATSGVRDKSLEPNEFCIGPI